MTIGRRLPLLASALLPLAAQAQSPAQASPAAPEQAPATAARPPAQERAPEQVSLNCDALSYRGTLNAATVKELEPVHDLAKVAAILTRRGIVFDRSRGVLTMALPPATKAAIDALPAGEPIVLPATDGGVVCVIVPAADSI